MLSSLLVHENNLLSLSAFQDLQLGEMFIQSCVLGSITGLSISWRKNNTLFVDKNVIKILPLHPSDNNTNYTCIITLQENPSGCPQNQSREYVIKLKSEYLLLNEYNKSYIYFSYLCNISINEAHSDSNHWIISSYCM